MSYVNLDFRIRQSYLFEPDNLAVFILFVYLILPFSHSMFNVGRSMFAVRPLRRVSRPGWFYSPDRLSAPERGEIEIMI